MTCWLLPTPFTSQSTVALKRSMIIHMNFFLSTVLNLKANTIFGHLHHKRKLALMKSVPRLTAARFSKTLDFIYPTYYSKHCISDDKSYSSGRSTVLTAGCSLATSANHKVSCIIFTECKAFCDLRMGNCDILLHLLY